MISPVTTSVRAKPDSAVVAAVDTARSALLEEVGRADVGEHLGHVVEDDRVVSHLFACERPGYPGWRWSVTVARASRHKQVTIDEVVLVPGETAIVAPPWVPYRERIKPGDLSPGDLLPVDDDDPRLVPTYSFGDDPLDADAKAQVRAVAKDLGLGRVRTLSPEGRDLAAQRWYEGDGGPDAPLARSAPDACTTCGFVIRIADFCKRVDFHKRGVVLLEATPHFQQNLRGLINIGMIEADAFSHLGGRFQIEIVKSIDMQTLHGFRMLFGDFLNLSTAIRSGEHVEITRGSVH